MPHRCGVPPGNMVLPSTPKMEAGVYFTSARPCRRQGVGGFFMNITQEEGRTSTWFFVHIQDNGCRHVQVVDGGEPDLRWLPVPADWAAQGHALLAGE